MTDIKICENGGIYTAYHIELQRGSDGQLQEVATPIHIPVPSADDLFSLREWTEELTDEQLNVAVQIFFDKWNFSSGDGRHKLILEALTDERDKREVEEEEDRQLNIFATWPTSPSRPNPIAQAKPASSLADRMRERIKKIGIKNKNSPPKQVVTEEQEINMAERIRRRMKEKANGV